MMGIDEFKAWFDGFTEAMDGPPNADQWERIKEKISQVRESQRPNPVLPDISRPPQREWPYRHPWLSNPISYSERPLRSE